MFTEGTELGLFNNLRRKRKVRTDAAHSRRNIHRRCHFEKMEPRQMLDANPVIAAITYLEDDLGQDITPDYFEVTFDGGAGTTQMTQFVINGDQDSSGGLSQGDMFFDVDSNLPGAGQFHGFQFHAGGSQGIEADDILGVSVSDDGLQLIVNVRNFEAGDTLAFTVDVDEVETLRADKIASGVEFEGTLFTATFVDENYTFEGLGVAVQMTLTDGQPQTQNGGTFYDEYDQLFSHGEDLSVGILDLTGDNQNFNADRTAGAIDAYQLIPKPIEISGTVYHDENLNCVKDGTEDGIPGVFISLEKLNTDTGQYETVAGTQTDVQGNYRFGEEFGLTPGTFRLVESQPVEFLDVGATVGDVDGIENGLVSSDGQGNHNIIGDINIPLGGTVAENYDFKEVLPAQIEGNVWHDRNNDGTIDPGEEGIANVLIQVTRIGSGAVSAEDPFAATEPIFIRTDTNGHYEVTSLPPGIYQITEINNYPAGSNPLVNFVDGKDSIGSVDGLQVGTQTNDEFSTVRLNAGDHGVEYNFGELKPASISGFVSITTPEGDCLDPTDSEHIGIAGVEVQLFDISGNLVASTTTNDDGFYEFDALSPGMYSIVEIQPGGYQDGPESIGVINGLVAGISPVNDRFVGIDLQSGDQGENYNFCEHLPASIQGHVWHDLNNDGIFRPSESGIAGVTIQLFDDSGVFVAETTTDSSGEYRFEGLQAGEYQIRQIQPQDYVDGKESIGNVDGLVTGENSANDEYSRVIVLGGQAAVDYDFGEIRLASIEGFVHLDPDGDCVFDADSGEAPMAGVTLQLLDSNGNTLAETTTDSQGRYRFENLLPGKYSIRQIQPDDVFTGGEKVGTGGGIATENLLTDIVIDSGQNLLNYNFCEHEAAEISGRVWEDGPAFQTNDGTLPEGYRDLRDGVYQPNIDTPIAGVRMELWYYIDPVEGAINPRPVTLGEVLGSQYDHLGNDPDAPIWVETSANGVYRFTGLPPGNYIVLESQPDGFSDANDTAGSTTGFSFNSASAANTQSLLLNTFSNEQIMDSVVNIRVNSGEVSIQNNFSEVRAVPDTPDVPTIPERPPSIPTPLPPGSPLIPGLGLAGAQSANFTAFIGGGRGIVVEALPAQVPYSWHLSVVNAGQPRAGDADADQSAWLQASFLSQQDWNRFDMDAGEWNFTTHQTNGEYLASDDISFFGMFDGIPLSGDFDGDGDDELVLFKNGYWMIDINGNGSWDIDDLMARLGDADDRPVVGDWDGDGKDDIGIFGPAWEGDGIAIEADPGIPDPDNILATKPKNIPPQVVVAADGARTMRLSSFGSSRVDVIDHVFGFGDSDDVPVAGDWNGDGIRTIGIFRDGNWRIDMNGDGRFDVDDAEFTFGETGDIPLVGDFNGDGIEEIAVYHNGTWIIDSNGNHQRDATDKVFEMGGRGDIPVVGDWNGDGIDEPAIYKTGATHLGANSSLQ